MFQSPAPLTAESKFEHSNDGFGKRGYYRRIAKTSRPYIKMSMLMIRVVFETLLNSIVCFQPFQQCYTQVRVVIKFKLFSRFYGIHYNTKICNFFSLTYNLLFYLLPFSEQTHQDQRASKVKATPDVGCNNSTQNISMQTQTLVW